MKKSDLCIHMNQYTTQYSNKTGPPPESAVTPKIAV